MRDDKEKLERILDCIDQIRAYTKDGKDAFLTGETRQPSKLEQMLKDNEGKE